MICIVLVESKKRRFHGNRVKMIFATMICGCFLQQSLSLGIGGVWSGHHAVDPNVGSSHRQHAKIGVCAQMIFMVVPNSLHSSQMISLVPPIYGTGH
jgi:hypothetical protein